MAGCRHSSILRRRWIILKGLLTSGIYHVMNDLSKAVKEKEQERYDRLCKEFEM